MNWHLNELSALIVSSCLGKYFTFQLQSHVILFVHDEKIKGGMSKIFIIRSVMCNILFCKDLRRYLQRIFLHT